MGLLFSEQLDKLGAAPSQTKWLDQYDDELSFPMAELIDVLSRAATECGTRPSIRTDFTDVFSQLLGGFSQAHLPIALVTQVLRFTGNACADCSMLFRNFYLDWTHLLLRPGLTA